MIQEILISLLKGNLAVLDQHRTDSLLINEILFRYAELKPDRPGKSKYTEPVLKKLIEECKADINYIIEGHTPLTIACHVMDQKFVGILCKYNGLNLNFKSAIGTALDIIAEHDSKQSLNHILEYNNRIKEHNLKNPTAMLDTLDFNTSIESGYTPLLRAIYNGSQDMVSKFLTIPEVDKNAANDQGLNALHIAVLHEKHNIIPILMSNGFDINSRTIEAKIDHKKTKKSEENKKSKDAIGITPLMLAIKPGANNGTKIETIKTLLEYGPNLLLQDTHGYTALSHACNQNNSDILNIIISYTKQKSIFDNIKNLSAFYDEGPIVPIALAAVNKNINSAKIMLEQEGIDLLRSNDAHVNLLTCAMPKNGEKTDILKLLAQKISEYNNDASHEILLRALLYAAEHNVLTAIPVLLKHIDVNSEIDGANAINTALNYKNLEVIKELLKYKPNINYQLVSQSTPELIAEFLKNKEYTHKILESAALTKGNTVFKKLCSVADKSIFNEGMIDFVYSIASAYKTARGEDLDRLKNNLNTLLRNISKKPLLHQINELLSIMIDDYAAIIAQDIFKNLSTPTTPESLKKALVYFANKENLEFFDKTLHKLSNLTTEPSDNMLFSDIFEYALEYKQYSLINYLVKNPKLDVSKLEPIVLIDVLKVLEDQKALITNCIATIRYSHNRTLIHKAAELNDLDFFNMINRLELDIDIDLRDESGFTAVHIAYKNKNENLIAILDDLGADNTAATKDGKQTPEEYALGKSPLDQSTSPKSTSPVTPPQSLDSAASLLPPITTVYKLKDSIKQYNVVLGDNLIKLEDQPNEYSWIHHGTQRLDLVINAKFSIAAAKIAPRFSGSPGIKIIPGSPIVYCKILGIGGDLRLLGIKHKMKLCAADGSDAISKAEDITVYDFFKMTTHSRLSNDIKNMQQLASDCIGHSHIEKFDNSSLLGGNHAEHHDV